MSNLKREQVIKALKESMFNKLQYNESDLVDRLKHIEIRIFNIRCCTEKFQYVNNNYEDIKYIFFKYDNNDTINNNLTNIKYQRLSTP
jgi:hypothetical protein